MPFSSSIVESKLVEDVEEGVLVFPQINGDVLISVDRISNEEHSLELKYRLYSTMLLILKQAYHSSVKVCL
jgi:hypothetical protein